MADNAGVLAHGGREAGRAPGVGALPRTLPKGHDPSDSAERSHHAWLFGGKLRVVLRADEIDQVAYFGSKPAGIRRLVVRIKAIEKEDLLLL